MKENIYFFIFIIITILFFASSVKAHKEFPCSKHKIYCHIKRLSPYMKHHKALKLSNLLYKYSKKYRTNPHVSVAIAMQESGLQEINRMDYAIYLKNNKFVISKVITDLGMFQLHAATIKYFKLDPQKLVNNFNYYVKQHVKLLAQKMRSCRKRFGITAWACYHSKTAKHHYRYYNAVKKYL